MRGPTLLLLLALAAPSCVIVPRYQRGTVADPAMDGSSETMSSRAMRKFHWAREGAAGGDGMAAGGGCGAGPERAPVIARALTLASLATLLAAPASAQDAGGAEDVRRDVEPVDEAILEAGVIEDDGTIVLEDDGPSWALERFAMRLGVFQQSGRGYQSQASTERWGPGSEDTLVLAPVLYARIAQPDGVTHDVYVPVDIVTAASPDALDAIASASRDTESVDLDVYSRVPTSDDSAVTLHWGGHVEEQFRSVYAGTAVSYEMADDNAVLTTSFDGIVDILDPVQPNGYDPGLSERFTGSLNVSLSQLLSPTTVVMGSYGATAQFGTIGTTWNSVPFEGGDRVPDLLPRHRLRHALAGQLRQAIEPSRTFFLVGYRFYADDFGLLAHTADGAVTQYLLDVLSLRVSYRFHQQSGVSFYTERLPASARLDTTYRTADSDLSPFLAHEVGATLRWYWDPRGAVTSTSSYLELSYYHYERTNGLSANVASLGWGWDL